MLYLTQNLMHNRMNLLPDSQNKRKWLKSGWRKYNCDIGRSRVKAEFKGQIRDLLWLFNLLLPPNPKSFQLEAFSAASLVSLTLSSCAPVLKFREITGNFVANFSQIPKAKRNGLKIEKKYIWKTWLKSVYLRYRSAKG